MTKDNAQYAEIVVETSIQASRAKVWQSLTEHIGQWWPADFYAGGEQGKRQYSLDPNPGGMMKEEWDGGGGVLWGTVICANPHVQLQVLGSLFPNWGGPSQWFASWDLSDDGNNTKLRFSETTMGRVSNALLEDKSAGWEVLGNALKAHAENHV